jgi:signal transduction histidine kinase
MPDQGRYVNERGQPLDIGAASQRRAVTRIDENGKSLAVLLHDAAALDDPDLMAGVVTAARLAVDNARMNAALGARVVDLNASRRRIVEATDAQRRRLERDLARGAAARLDDAAESLRTYRVAKASAEIDLLIAELEGTRRDLHEFAQGIRPRKLSAGGLAEALPFLASRSPIPVVLQVDPGRHPPAIESSLYFVCSEALTNAAKHSQATHIDVVVTHGEGIVEVTIRDDGVGGAELSGHGLRGMADRVHALGGTISIDPVGSGGTNIRVRLPTAPGSSMDPA